MSGQKLNIMNFSLRWGVFTGVILLACLVMQYLVMDRSAGLVTTGLLHYLILSSCISVMQKRMLRFDSSMTFANLFLAGIVCGFSSSLFVDLYSAVYLRILNPGFVDQSVEQSVQLMEELRIYSSDDIERVSDFMSSSFLPIYMVSTSLFYLFVSMLFSALSAFLTTKAKPGRQ